MQEEVGWARYLIISSLADFWAACFSSLWVRGLLCSKGGVLGVVAKLYGIFRAWVRLRGWSCAK